MIFLEEDDLCARTTFIYMIDSSKLIQPISAKLRSLPSDIPLTSVEMPAHASKLCANYRCYSLLPAKPRPASSLP